MKRIGIVAAACTGAILFANPAAAQNCAQIATAYEQRSARLGDELNALGDRVEVVLDKLRRPDGGATARETLRAAWDVTRMNRLARAGLSLMQSALSSSACDAEPRIAALRARADAMQRSFDTQSAARTTMLNTLREAVTRLTTAERAARRS